MTMYRKGVRIKIPKNPEVLHGLQEIALYLGVSYNTARRYIILHGLPATKVGEKYISNRRAITAWIFAGHEALLMGKALEDKKAVEEGRKKVGQL
jgi:excisionase family DNA binding protein